MEIRFGWLKRTMVSAAFLSGALFGFQNCAPFSSIAEETSTTPDDETQSSLAATTREFWISPNMNAHDQFEFYEPKNGKKWFRVLNRLTGIKVLRSLGSKNPNLRHNYPGEARLRAFGKFMRAHQKKVAVEVNVLDGRKCALSPELAKGYGLGVATADFEWREGVGHLSETMGIDYLVLDGPFWRVFQKKGAGVCNMSPSMAALQIAKYMHRMKQYMPNVKFILLVNLTSEILYGTPGAPDARFEYVDVFNLILKTMARQQLRFEAVEIDYPYNVTGFADLHFWRIQKMNELARSKRLKTKMILNAMGPGISKDPDVLEPNKNYPPTPSQLFASQQFGDGTVHMYRELEKRGIRFNGYVLQSWMQVPYWTLPETKQGTFLNTGLRLLQAGLL